MQIHQGNAGGPDCSNANETNQVFVKTAEGTMKATFSGSAGEKKVLRLSTDQSAPYKTVSVTNTQKSNGNVGWGNASGNFHANGKSAGQGAQIANYHPGQKLGTQFPHYDDAGYLIVEIGADGAPMTVTFGEGVAV